MTNYTDKQQQMLDEIITTRDGRSIRVVSATADDLTFHVENLRTEAERSRAFANELAATKHQLSRAQRLVDEYYADEH